MKKDQVNYKSPCYKSLYKPLFALACMAVSSGIAMAAMTAAEVDRLGKDLTPMGAEKAGNQDGSIPGWDGGISHAPAGFDPKAGYLDPYATEKPLFIITAANMLQYKDKLTAGQIELMKRYPDYKLNVYASHRTAAYPQGVYDAVKSEASKAAVIADGNGVANIAKTSVPFPMPKSGIEVIWNHLMRWRGGTIERYSAEFPVQANGAFTPVTRKDTLETANAMGNPEPNSLLYFMSELTGPSSVAGEGLLVIDPINQVAERRKAWVYNPGQRRVLRAPDISYDSPGIAADGLRTTDDYDGYNGSPDRYDWKLIGKKEIFISYNNFKISNKSLKYTDVVRPGHLNQDLIRYELHRVWVVEATLKPGKRHIYAKRTFYVDEDSWQVAHADSYDGRGELWRVHEIGAIQFYDAPTLWFTYETNNDLQSRRYLVTGLSNQEKPIKFGRKLELNYFSPDNLRRSGN